MTIPGPDLVIECPRCSNLLRYFTMLTTNTIGAVLWTDGNLTGPMYVPPEELFRCPHCKELFWREEAQVRGQYEYEDTDVPEEFYKYPGFNGFDLNEYPEIFQQRAHERLDGCEQHLRILYWWQINDLIREDEQSEEFLKQRPNLIDNLRALDPILEGGNGYDKILRAEISRELGEFDECLHRLAILNDLEPIPEDAKRHILRIEQLAREKNNLVQPI